MKLVMLLGKYPPEEAQRRKDLVRRYASAGTEIEFKELSGSFFANQSGSVDRVRAEQRFVRAPPGEQFRGAGSCGVDQVRGHRLA